MKSVKPFRRIGRRLLYENEPVYLAGGPPQNVHLPADPAPPLAPLVRYGHNIWRHWMIAYWLYSKDNLGTPDHNSRALNSPFFYDLVGKKWNLTRYNAGYFHRLRATIEAAAQRGITVVVSLFDRSGLDYVTADKERRWPNNPWNQKNNVNGVIVEDLQDTNVHGLPEFFHIFGPGSQERTLQDLQRRYIQKVAAELRGYWNVFFEIMNEPYLAGSVEERVRWADWVTGVLHAAAGGSARKQLIYYNDSATGDDLDYWRTQKAIAGFTHYSLVEGVSFHGDPNTIEPGSTAYTFRGEKVFLVSSDAGPTPQRDQEEWNRTTTQHALSRDMQFTAEPDKLLEGIARGISRSLPPPRPLLRPAFLYHWRKVAENPPSPVPDNFHLRFYGDGSLRTFFSEPYQPLSRGVVLDFLGDLRIRVWDDVVRQPNVLAYTFSPDGQELRLRGEADGFEQVFQRFPQATPERLGRFLYHWTKVGESPPSPVPDHFDLRFYADGSFLTFFNGPYRVAEHGEVRNLTSNRMELFSLERGELSIWTYSFLDSGRLLRIQRLSDGFQQDFRRTERPGLGKLVGFVYPWEKIGENPSTPTVPDRFHLRFASDGSFTVYQPDVPYEEWERGEILQLLSGNRIQLHSHTRGVDETWTYRFTLNKTTDVLTLSLNNGQGFEQTFRRG